MGMSVVNEDSRVPGCLRYRTEKQKKSLEEPQVCEHCTAVIMLLL